MLTDAGQTVEKSHDVDEHGHGRIIKILIGALSLWALLPVFHIGTYTNASGDRSFDLWYLMVFLVIAFFLMHEVITPLPPKDPV